jgi:pectin methylesterase-like acyl-CoA thioesterase
MVKNQLHTFVCTLIALLGSLLFPMQISAQDVNSDVTATWPFDLGTEGQTATFTPEGEADGWFRSSYVTLRSNLFYIGKEAPQGGDDLSVQTQVSPVNQKDNGATADNALEFMFVPKTGLKFTPTRVAFTSSIFGTNGGYIDISWVNSDGTTILLGSDINPARNNGNGNNNPGKYSTQFDYKVEGKASDGACGLRINIYKLDPDRKIGFANIVIEGHIEGTIQDVKQCYLTVQVSPEGAGAVSVQPAGSMTFDENTELTLTQTRNFGYKFTGWSVGNETVSTDDTYKFIITDDVTVTANYEAIPTYALTYGATGGGKDYMITPTPEPTVVDGKNMYEERQEVTLTATGNYILDFANWSTGESTPEIKVTMDGDKSVTAAFSASKDVIAGWDFYKEGNNGRIADFYADGNDATALVMRNEAGETSSWLDKSYEGDPNGYEGRYAAVNWRTTGLGEYYWQTQINAEAFKDIKVRAEMLYNFNAYPKQDVEYSLDGTEWTPVGSYNITGSKVWTEGEFTLPEAANNQPTVYIRWKSDKTSTPAGTESQNDGISIAGIYITGTPKIIDDGAAPVLESTVPAEGSTNASANGRIVLNFDEKVKVAEGTVATLNNGMELEPTVSGQTVMFEYKGLDYATPYTFTLPANTVSDLTDNTIANEIAINFTTMTRPVVTKALYDFVVPDDGTITEALAAAAARDDVSQRFYIFVKQGDIVIPASETATVTSAIDGKQYPSPITTVNTPNVSIIGEGMDITSIANTVPDNIKNDEGEDVNPIEGLGTSTNILFGSKATNMYVQDITFRNSIEDGMGRNVALEDNGDRNAFKNVRLYGYQDTYYSHNQNGRFYFEGGELRGRTDYLCGSGDLFCNGVTLMVCGTGGYITAPGTPTKYGYIFRDCTIESETDDVNGNYTLGRPWGEGTPIALYINTRMEAQPSAAGWSEMSGGWPARFAEYNSTTASGTVISLSGRKTIFADTHENNPILTKEEADFYTVANVMGGDDDWNPTSLTEQASAPTNVKIAGTLLTWDDNQYVLCWAICKDGKVVDFTTSPEYTVDDAAATYSIRAANQMGGLGEATTASIDTGIDEIEGAEAGEAVSTEYYSVDGTRVSSDYRGVVIEVSKMADGSKTVRKTIRK